VGNDNFIGQTHRAGGKQLREDADLISEETDCARGQIFAAGFVTGKRSTIKERHFDAAPGQKDRGGRTGGACPDDNDVALDYCQFVRPF
jgi:hypothetical protein